ncbi:hypothetical protein LGH82_31345 [Mesorhizobium sp. PAMC28654]|uniref:hypothetical protein n=1 Tax=Mesorhizobium sp. PAMC28654 TaxID=2880934 RepID=UPI001D0B51B0|nr:hypothetical protein [Mesorhizobium sp. PAMC28654]UDL89497.1 hypothetical protein LGH82_31345 [Mesorhizobium sp. PAMC28654]
MRSLMILLLVLCADTALANEADLERKIGDCLILPGAAVNNGVKAVFEVTLDKAGKVKSVTAVSYEPHSMVAAGAARILAKSLQKRWPPGIKTSPVRITVDLSKF